MCINIITIASTHYINFINTDKVSLTFGVFHNDNYYTRDASSVYGKLRTYHSLYLNVQPGRLYLLIISTRV